MRPLRLFLAVDPEDAVRDRLRAALVRVRPLSPRARWVDPAALHVTLAFLGDVEPDKLPTLVAAAADVANRHAPMTVRFTGAGVFGGRRPRVLWVGLTGEMAALGAVQEDLAAVLAPLGFAGEDRAFSPHVTIARATERGGDRLLDGCAAALAEEDFGASRLSAMVLYQSELTRGGPVYTKLADVRFAEAHGQR